MLALLSVSDKRGLVPFARGLVEAGFSLLSTGGTLEVLKKEGIAVTKVSEHTGSPEILGGRVKTLHPRIHGGILGRPDLESDRAEMAQHQIPAIQIVAVNLYPFRQTIAQGVSDAEAIEQIDIGGPAMVRAAAKNSAHVAVVVDPDDYPAILEEVRASAQKQISAQTRRRLMLKAYQHTAAYDASIAAYLAEQAGQSFPEELSLSFRKVQELRYGENPHQRGAFYREHLAPKAPTVAFSQVRQGKELSYNNILDLDAALALALEFHDTPCAVVIKHNTPCGVATGADLEQTYRAARAIDEVSAFGGIVALNRPVDGPTATALAETFLEAVIAPAFSPEARGILAAKKNLRLLEVGETWKPESRARPFVEARSVAGGIVYQDRDAHEPQTEWKLVTRRAPTEAELAAMKFAWRVCKHVKSNAIVFSTADRLVAQGGGQTSRVDSAKIATGKGGEAVKGTACASDAFFPFRDGLDEAARAGASCIVQPGGSVRDAELIAAADEHGLAMVFTGIRHFRH
ncbi:MAG: bifunctional phosphoribosylaminoimidazolecarboxamide formyltransferase/IMP cyclohydrolase [Myxococcota bacterium]|nr:bifunctional phosphoribosylaminoimidazolecarboxamide formyltransferase/IMP cyclohydrolase [Myxococcota bacterium]